ncbi:MAG TPA: LLM class flavin-dependent oxidoreductase [Acidimicrobiales bacterium]|nr:LLM class flavin-dependent oxidoreductase [Acidimicrobiales bacterium]
MTPVGSGSHDPSLGLILPASLQGELLEEGGSTFGTTTLAASGVGTAGDLAAVCRRAEGAGADSLWAVDHLYWPHPIGEAMTTLAVAATATSRPALGTCVLQLPLRQPDAVAKQATALQLLSGGRFVLGLGVGSHEAEYQRAAADFRHRGRTLDEAVTRLRAAWGVAGSGHAPGEDDGYVQHPRSATVPLWFGGAGAAARRRAARVGDGWVPLFLTPEDYAEALGALRRETAAAGRPPEAVEPAVVVFVRIGDDHDAPRQGAAWLSELYRLPPHAFRRHLVAGSPEACAAALRNFTEAGARHIVVMVAGSPAVEHFEALRAAFAAREPAALSGSRA